MLHMPAWHQSGISWYGPGADSQVRPYQKWICAETSAEESAAKFIPASEHLVGKIMLLFDGTSMPVSDTKWLPAAA